MLQRLKVIGIVLFVLVDLIAIGFGFKHVTGHVDTPGESVVGPTRTTPSDTTESQTPTTSRPTGLSVFGGSVAQFSIGSCRGHDAPKVELALDQGGHFREIALPVEAKADSSGKHATAVTQILALKLTSAIKISVVAEDLECKPVQYRTNDAGRNWTQSSSVSDWYVDKAKLQAPGSAADPGCDALSAYAITDNDGRVICQSGRIVATSDGGRSWSQLGVLANVSVASFGSLPNGYGIAKTSDCDSRAYQTSDGGQTWTSAGCISRNHEASAVSGSAEVLCALVQGDLYVSTNNGSNWKLV